MGPTLKIFLVTYLILAALLGAPKGLCIAEDAAVKEAAGAEETLTEGTMKIDKEKISLDLKGIDIIELFRILSVKMDLTIVPTKAVTGRVNVFLNNLTFDDALDVILISQDLACDRSKGNIINIMTSGEFEKLYGKKYNEKRKIKTIKLTYAKPATVFNALGQIKSDIGKIITDEATGNILLIDIPEKIELMEKTAKELDQPLVTEIIDLQYAKTADMKTQLAGVMTVGPGELIVDDRSSKVVVTDLPEKMKKIRRMVKALDEKSREVLIEAEVVQVTLKDEHQRAINWERVLRDLDSATIKAVLPVATSFTPSPLLTADYLSATVGTLANDKYTATLKLLETFGETKILSRPRISVINNQEAKIMVGSREAYVTQSQSQASDTTVTSESIQFIDVGVKLNVVPTINADGFVTMKIKPEVSSVRETLTTALGSTVPIVETSEAETTVKVKDGTMIMIAGLMKEEKRDDTSGLPFFGRLPLVGWIFSTRSGIKKKTEVVVFLTPHIMSGERDTAEKEQERWVPPDMVPENWEDDLILHRVEDLKMKAKPTVSSAKEIELPKEAVMEKTIEDRIKGIKEY